MEIGDIIKPTTESKFILHCGMGVYEKAIVISLEPFIITSDDSTMKWEATIKKEYFEVIGKTDSSTLKNCKRRLTKHLIRKNIISKLLNN